MPFEIVSTADESSFLDDQISEILSSDNVPLPPFDQRVGHVDVRWEDVGSQRAWLQTRGGTPEDQLLARSVVGAQLASCGFREATRDWGMEKTADWSDVTAKAKRLMQSGSVQILRNGYNNIVAQVQGDHGSYQSEIWRDDPTSRAISSSDCECAYGEFQNQPRTRQWKKIQGRPCWLPGSLVSMADGTRMPIENVQPGDRVLSAHGVQTVSHHWTNEYSGEMQTIRWMGSAFGTTVTHDHKMITHPAAADTWRAPQDSADRSRKTARVLQEDGWEKTLAHEVKVDDWIKLSYATETQAFDLDVAELSGLSAVDGRCRVRNHSYSMPSRVVESEDVEALLTLAGYYLAEGSIEVQGKVVSWSFNASETDYVDAIENALTTLGAGPLKRYHPGGNRFTVRVSNAVLAQVLDYLCGHGSRTKRLAPELMLLPVYEQMFFLERYAEGDGTGSDFSSMYVINTASEMLARQLVTIGSRLYRCIPTLSWFKNNGGPTRRDANDLMIARVKFNQVYNCGVVRLRDGYYAARVTSVETVSYSGEVYNLTVPPYHTVTVDGVCSYQCSHILAAFWQAQSMPLDEDANPANPQGGQPGPQTFGPDATQGFDPAQRSFGPNDASPFGPPSGAQPGPDPGAQGGGEAPPGPSPADVLPQYPMAQMPQPPPQNMTSIPGATPPTPTNPVQYPAGPGGTFSSVQNPWDVWHMSGLDDSTDMSSNADTPANPNPVYQNGDLVQLRYPDTGTLVGRSEEHGAGQPTDLQPGMVGEVLGTHPTTGMHNVLWAGKAFSQNKEFEPWGSVGWHFPSYLLPRKDLKKPGPAIRRRR